MASRNASEIVDKLLVWWYAQFYLTTNASSERPSVEIVYVSLDEDRETFERARSMMPWCSVEYDSDVRRNLINRYHVTDEELSKWL